MLTDEIMQMAFLILALSIIISFLSNKTSKSFADFTDQIFTRFFMVKIAVPFRSFSILCPGRAVRPTL